ncbi:MULTISPECIES: 3-hydroxybutyrate dehydrogenase [Agrobacterium]|uniref:3-hydroxybutyrate dehydrogenase n=1 Tax=Agrobacterium TaxID=357 RepID=UPI0022B810CE|nr:MULTISPECIES: 3-hydroxybutyrate dehydrogenase [Agrobacterium]MCZ7887792.1 3-hydroxybutyrate dehydrogenase [Agrobacterium salinitolerans]MDA5629937.1 3-hydroxybutyrate dehydrogenase [Agrobacterium sp. ST15.16.055]MDA6980708.1 3-hydroxybutyrate dehydrogenase [Agrobacterium salinitolerans]
MEDQPKTALVTGSTSGIGLAIAKRFAEAGFRVALHGIEAAEEATPALEAVAKAARHRPVYFAANLAHYDESAHLPETVIAEFGHIDVLVNNAGIQKVAPIDEFDFADFSRIVAISLDSAFHTIHAALPGMKERGWGRIVNIASAHGLRASPFKGPYVATKHAVVGLTKSVALEVAELGITCNAICPGYVWTPLVAAQVADQARVHGMSEEDVVKKVMLAPQPTRRFVQPEEVAEMALYLAGDMARSITGATISIDGGWTAK